MQKKLLYPFLFLIGSFSYAQLVCPTLNSPLDGQANVPVDTSISWDEVAGTQGYLISLGTTPGGTDLIDQLGVSSASYTPPFGLPENTTIYVTISLFFFDQDNIECPGETFRTEDVTVPPACTSLVFPANGATDVDVDSSLDWEYAPKSTGYRLTVGTSSNGGEILNDVDIGNITSYEPTADLPFETPIFVRIVPYNENGEAVGTCTTYNFTTESRAIRPNCTAIVFPQDGAVDVPLTPIVEWETVPGAAGYRVSLGTAPSTNNILNNADYATNSTPVIDFLPDRTFHLTVVPFNDAGEAIGCNLISFTTTKGCGPFLDDTTGEMVFLGPEIHFPDEVYICLNENVAALTANEAADGYRWYRVNDDATETLLSETSEVALSEEGTYRYEAFNTIWQSGNSVECSASKEFKVFTSEIATIRSIDIVNQSGGSQVIVRTQGIGIYEFALDNREGPYQNANVFNNVSTGSFTVYVRDKNGCGITEGRANEGPTQEDFPSFFTPNGDHINDFWQFAPEGEGAETDLDTIYIFDKFGNLITQIAPASQGWDGTFNGKLLPASDYWYRAVVRGSVELKGHFTLKR